MAQHSHDPHALNLFFHPLGTRSTPRAAVLSAASSGSGTQIP